MESVGSYRNENNLWNTKLRNNINGENLEIKSNLIINACGPFVDQQNNISNMVTKHKHVYSKGIHLIVPKITKNKRILTFFADDGRLFFAIPLANRTMVGTTDTNVKMPETGINKEDRKFVLENINKRLNLKNPLKENDIISEKCGVRPLVTRLDENDNKYEEWTKLSRKHEIDVNFKLKHISIFGGKLTDCLNIGEEISNLVQQMGILLSEPKRKWYGEPTEEIKKKFFDTANAINLDKYTSKTASEKISERLWRLYGANAINISKIIIDNPETAEPLIEGTDYLKCELTEASLNEMIINLDDFLKRRSRIALVASRKELKDSDNLKEACKILFKENAEEKWNEYFHN